MVRKCNAKPTQPTAPVPHQGWKVIKSVPGRYVVFMPGIPRESKSPVAINAVKGTLLWEKDIVLDQIPGREILVAIPNSGGMQFYSRFYLVEQRAYQQAVLGKEANLSRQDVQLFLNSLQILKEK